MIARDLAGLPLDEALAILDGQGIRHPEAVLTKPPIASFDTTGRTLRVVSVQDGRLIAGYFRDGEPEEGAE